MALLSRDYVSCIQKLSVTISLKHPQHLIMEGTGHLTPTVSIVICATHIQRHTIHLWRASTAMRAVQLDTASSTMPNLQQVVWVHSLGQIVWLSNRTHVIKYRQMSKTYSAAKLDNRTGPTSTSR